MLLNHVGFSGNLVNLQFSHEFYSNSKNITQHIINHSKPIRQLGIHELKEIWIRSDLPEYFRLDFYSENP